MAPLNPEKRKLLEAMLRKKGLAVSSQGAQTTIPRRAEAAILPLALNQEGLWFIDQLNPGKANYNIPGTVRLLGRLDVDALSQSLSEILRRHEVLRTTFVADKRGQPQQIVNEVEPVPLPLTDLQDLPPSGRETEARRLATLEARRPFDLSVGPLIRFHLLKLSAQEHVMMLNIHHIVADGWSMGILTNELSSLYTAYASGRANPLPELPIQFGDYALWQKEWMQGPTREVELAYWRENLAGNLPELNFPVDRPRPKAFSYNGGHSPINISNSLTDSLRQLARIEKVTLFPVLLAAFNATLCYYTEQRDIIIGSTYANRNLRELENLIGFFVNTLPLRTDLSGNPSFRELIDRVQQTSLGAGGRQVLPLSALVQELQPKRNPDRNPIYQVVFDLLTPDRNPAVYGYGMSSNVSETLELNDLKIVPMDVEGEVARFDIAIFIWDMPDGLSGVFEYCTDILESNTIASLIKRYLFVLQQIVADPSITLHVLLENLRDSAHDELSLQAKTNRGTTLQKLKKVKRRSIRVSE